MRYIPALDGLRALAVTLVVAHHALIPGFSGGFFGVDLFFVLSGFLITSILLNEINATGTVRIGKFYLRRIRRLTPALACLLLGYIVLAPFAWPEASFGHHVREVFFSAAYLSDYTRAFTGVPALLGHTWSLAVEEHFYLLWPFVLAALCHCLPLNKLPLVFCALFVAVSLWRLGCYAAGQEWPVVYFRFDTHFSGLCLGALLAALSLNKAVPRVGMLSLLCAAVFFIFTVIFIEWGTLASISAGISFAELFAFMLIAHVLAHENTAVARLLSQRGFVFLGQISYGLYLYHAPILLYLVSRYGFWAGLLIGVPLSVGLAAASYFLIERRFLTRKPGQSPVAA